MPWASSSFVLIVTLVVMTGGCLWLRGLRCRLGLSTIISRAFPIAIGLEFNNQRMVDELINRSDRHHVIGKNGIPLAEGLVGGNQ